MKKKTILFIEFLTDTAANHLLMMIKGLQDAHLYNIIILCQKNSSLHKELVMLKIYHIYAFDYHIRDNTSIISRFWRNCKYFITLMDIIIFNNVDIIHSHRLAWGYIAALPSILLHKPLIIHIVIIENPTGFIKKMILINIKTITYIAVSKSAKSQFLQLLPISPKKIKVHYGGLYFPDINFCQTIKIHPLENLHANKKIIIGMISRIDPAKGVDIFIETAGILSQQYPNLHFIHVGIQKSEKRFKGYLELCFRRVANLNLTKKFSFFEYSENVLAFYKYCYITILPSLKETLSYVTLESSAYKVPTIFTDIEAISEIYSDISDCSIPFPPSPFLLSNKIITLLNDKNKYYSIQNKIINNVISKFDSNKNAYLLSSIYEKINN